jgi:hypothetical protein
MAAIITRAVVRMPIAMAMIESTSPAVAILRYETERRPRADMTMPTIGIGRPKTGYHELIIAMMPSTRPAMAKPIPLPGDVAGTAYAE